METPSDAAASAPEKEKSNSRGGAGGEDSSDESDEEKAVRDAGTGEEEERRAAASVAAAAASIGEKQSPNDFDFLEMLGEGSYSRVMRAVHKATEQEFAVKVVEKALVIREKKQKYVVMERDVLNRCRHPNVVRLFCTFQDNQELFRVLEAHGTLSLTCGRFFAAEILDVLQFIHHKQVIHRDLKPENLLISDSGHIKVTDFGTAKIITEGEGRSRSFCGTAEYVSPELLENKGACQVSRLLVLDPLQRLGADAHGNATKYEELRSHAFFAGVTWENPALHAQAAPPITKLIPKKELRRELGKAAAGGGGGGGGGEGGGEQEQEAEGVEDEKLSTASPLTNRDLSHVLLPNEQIAHSSVVSKRKADEWADAILAAHTRALSLEGGGGGAGA